jgi:TRAP-type mannitol/chloroaromatic compound transport system permease small subunit
LDLPVHPQSKSLAVPDTKRFIAEGNIPPAACEVEGASVRSCMSSIVNPEGSFLPRSLAATAESIERLSAAIGRAVMWLSLLIVLLQFAVVVMRYAFAIGSIWLSESIIYGHAALFLLAAGWTLQQNGHVRVDIFYSKASARGKAIVDLLGALLLLLPFVAVIGWFGSAYAARSWSILERSPEASGLPFVYVLKTLIPLFALLLGLQGIAQAIRAGLLLSKHRVAGATFEKR